MKLRIAINKMIRNKDETTMTGLQKNRGQQVTLNKRQHDIVYKVKK